jgi:catechol 2,3-dioxygenase-like lactoylglutathione lyase family enzyme
MTAPTTGIAIRGVDHIVLTVGDVDRSLAFYCDVLGLSPERLAEFRAGKIGFPSVRIHEHFVIDLFPRPGKTPSTDPNLNHFCLVTDAERLEPLVEHLQRHGITINRGPVLRWGAQGTAVSVYFNDPDGNEVEIRTYAAAAREAAEQAAAEAGA